MPLPLDQRISLVLDVFCLQAFETLHWHMLDESEHFFLRVFIFIALSRHAHTDTLRHIADATAPNKFIQLGVNANVFGAHHFGSELTNLTDCSWSTLLELELVEVLVKV